MSRTLVNRDFTVLWAGQAVSQFGSLVSATGLPLWIGAVLLRGRAGAPLVSGGLLLLTALAGLAVAPLAGVLVDRWDPRRTMLRADLVRGLVSAGLAAALLLPGPVLPVPARLGVTAAAVVVITAAGQFFGPAATVLLGDLVPPDRLGRAAGYNQSAYALLAILAPTVASALVFTVGVGPALVVDAATFAVSWLAIRLLRPTGRGAREPRAAGGGLGEVRRNPAVRALLVAIGLAMVGYGALDSLTVYFVRYDLHAGGAWYGLLPSALGVGTLLGGLVGGRLGDRLGPARTYGGTLLLLGLLVLGYARLAAPGPALVVSALLGVALGGVNVVFTPLLLRLVPRGAIGRVSSLVNAVGQAATLGSIALSASAVSAWLATTGTVRLAGLAFGPVDTVYLGCGVLCALGGIHVLRRVRLPAAVSAPASPASAGSPGPP